MVSGGLQWRTEKRYVRDLVPWDANPRKITEKQAEDLRKSLDRFGVAEIPVVDSDNRLVGGHQRCAILMAQGKGDLEIDVRVPDRKLTDEEYTELNLRLNKNVAEWDFDLLANLDEDLLLSVGFSDDELVVGFGLSRAGKSLDDPDRYCVLTVEPPEAPRLKVRMSFHCDSVEEYLEIKRAFGKFPDDPADNQLDKERFLELLRRAVGV